MSLKSLGQGLCWEGALWSCSLGTGLPHQESQKRVPLGAELGKPGGDVREKREEFSTYFYVALCICPGCFALNSVVGNLTGMWGVSSGISPAKQGREWQKNIVYDKSSAVENSFGSWAKGRLLRSIMRKFAWAASQNVLLLWLQKLEVWERWREWAFQIDWSGSFCFRKIVFGKKKWGGGQGWGRESCFSLTGAKQC